MKVKISEEIFSDYPQARTGWLAADVRVTRADYRTMLMKRSLVGRLHDIGISTDTMLLHPDINRWRDVYKKMGVRPGRYFCSLEALLRRVFKGDIISVSNIADSLDCISAINLLPICAYDADKIKGDLTLRYGRADDCFNSAKSAAESITPENIVYADDESVTCWLWNHCYADDVAVTNDTRRALFIIDSAFETEFRSVEQGLEALSSELSSIECKSLASGVLSKDSPEADVRCEI